MCTFSFFLYNPLISRCISLLTPLWFDSEWQGYGQIICNGIFNLLPTPVLSDAKPTLFLKLFLFGGLEKGRFSEFMATTQISNSSC